jgi:peptidoglycan/LPS O-acetylase OafA/YrhL
VKRGAPVADALLPPPPATGSTFPILDTLRAVGALAVLTTHAAFWAGDYTRHGAWGTFLSRLDVGVAIFFVLSGFLLSRPWLARAADGRSTVAIKPYFWNRLLRIAPVYVLAVVLALSLVEDNDALGPADWTTTLLMLDTVTGSGFPAGLTQMWSLAVEVSFYMVLPLLMLAAVGRRRALSPPRVLLCLAAMAVITVWWHLDGAARAGDWSDGSPLQWLPSYLLWFALGIALALVQVLHDRGAWKRLTSPVVSLARQPGSCWAAAGGLLLVASTPLAGPSMLAAPTPAQSLTKTVVYAAVGTLVVMTGVFARPGSGYDRLFGSRTPRRLGWISYGVFCLHLPVLHFVMWSTGWPLFEGRGFQIWAATLVLSLVAAEIVYRVVERPALRFKIHESPRGSMARASAPETGTSIR